MSLQQLSLHPFLLIMLMGFSSAPAADSERWGTVAQSGDAVYLARGSMGGDDIPESPKTASPDEDDVDLIVPVSSEDHIGGGARGRAPLGGKLILAAQDSAEVEKPPLASQIARGDVVERDEPVMGGNVPVKLAIGVGTVALSSGLDKSGEHFGRQHGDHRTPKIFSRIGNALPLVALGGAGLAAVTSEDPRVSRTAVASLEAGGGAVLTSLGLKYAIGRSRPETGAGPSDFHPFSANNGNSSMPSIHTAAVWGAVTPFAKEYDMPWLYGAAALTNYARVADRKHWVSDTVAGSLLGYLAGDIAWHWNRSAAGIGSQVYLGPNSIGFNFPLH